MKNIFFFHFVQFDWLYNVGNRISLYIHLVSVIMLHKSLWHCPLTVICLVCHWTPRKGEKFALYFLEILLLNVTVFRKCVWRTLFWKSDLWDVTKGSGTSDSHQVFHPLRHPDPPTHLPFARGWMCCFLGIYSGYLWKLNHAKDSGIKSKSLKLGLTWEL